MIAQVLNTPSKSEKQIIANKATHYFFNSLSELITSTLKHVFISILEIGRPNPKNQKVNPKP